MDLTYDSKRWKGSKNSLYFFLVFVPRYFLFNIDFIFNFLSAQVHGKNYAKLWKLLRKSLLGLNMIQVPIQ